MSHERLIAIPCKISGGIVSDERGFEITLSNGESHSGVAPVHYFWNEAGARLGHEEPNGSEEIQGKIAARILSQGSHDILVSIPDGSVVKVDTQSFSKRPTEVRIHVSLGSRP